MPRRKESDIAESPGAEGSLDWTPFHQIFSGIRAQSRATTPRKSLASIPSVIHPVFCPVDRILALVLSVVRTTVRSIPDTVPAFFTMILFVIDTIGGIVSNIMPSLDTSAHASGEDYRLGRFVACALREARERR